MLSSSNSAWSFAAWFIDAEIDDEILVYVGAEHDIQVCVEAHLRSLSSWFVEQDREYSYWQYSDIFVGI